MMYAGILLSWLLYVHLWIQCQAYAPVVICPGFGNDSIDYDTPLSQPSSVGLKSVLSRRGFPIEKIYTVPVKRIDWIRVALGLLDIPRFYTNDCLPSGLGYGWYIQRLKEEVDRAYEESGGEKVILLAHSAGGWLARAAMADGVWCTERKIQTSDRIQCLVTLGAIHRVPEINPESCVTRGALKNTDALFPGAFLKEYGVTYITVGGSAIVGDDTLPEDLPDVESSQVDDIYSKRGEGSSARVAYTSYQAVSGKGNVIGDGVVPLDWSHLPGAKQITLDGVVHSINEAGTTIPSNRWYGSEDVIDRWLPLVLQETGLTKTMTSSVISPLPSFPFSNLFSKFDNKKPIKQLGRRDTISGIISLSAAINLLSSPSQAIYENAPVFENKPTKLDSGVSYQDLRVGEGATVDENKRVNIQWSLKRSNGYSIDSSSNYGGQPFIFVVGSGSDSGLQRAIAGLDEGIRGMKVGGIRRIVVPPNLAYVEGLNDGMPGPIPYDFGPQQRVKRVMNMIKDNIPGESFILDVKVTRVQ